MQSANARNLMLNRGFIAMNPFSLNLVPWNSEYGSQPTLAYTQLTALSNFDHNAYAQSSGHPHKHVQIQISGIPPHLCSNATVSTLLHSLATVHQIIFNATNHTYHVSATTYCPHEIPPTAALAIKRMLDGRLLFHVWPIGYNSVDITPLDALSFNHGY